MKSQFPIVAVIAASLFSSAAAAHSLTDLESDLRRQERYAQFVDSQAPDFQLTDLAGKPVSLAGLRGQVLVMNFIYSRCKDICPLHMVLIAKLQSMVNAAGMQERVRFVTIATDEEDVTSTRKIMSGYAKSYGLDTRNWQFLYRTGAQPAAATRAVAEAYGLKFTPVADGVQMHGAVTHVIDQTGQLRARFHGLKFEPVHLVSFVNALVNDDHGKK